MPRPKPEPDRNYLGAVLADCDLFQVERKSSRTLHVSVGDSDDYVKLIGTRQRIAELALMLFNAAVSA